MFKCTYADKYQAIRAPRCGGADGPCDECARKWALASRAREGNKRDQEANCGSS